MSYQGTKSDILWDFIPLWFFCTLGAQTKSLFFHFKDITELPQSILIGLVVALSCTFLRYLIRKKKRANKNYATTSN